MRRGLVGLIGCLTLVLAGCGGDGKVSVSGTVTMDGTPVEEGHIVFVPSKGGEGGGGTIKNGSYSAKIPKGNYRVEITASKKMPLPPGQVGMDGAKEEVRQYIPDKYNTKSELKADVPPPGALDFQLKSK